MYITLPAVFSHYRLFCLTSGCYFFSLPAVFSVINITGFFYLITGCFVSLPSVLSHFRLFCVCTFVFNTLEELLPDVRKHYRLFCLTSGCFVSRSFSIRLKNLYRIYIKITGHFVSLPAFLSIIRLTSGSFVSFSAVFSLYFVFNTHEEPLPDVHEHYRPFFSLPAFLSIFREYCLTTGCFVSLSAVFILYVCF